MRRHAVTSFSENTSPRDRPWIQVKTTRTFPYYFQFAFLSILVLRVSYGALAERTVFGRSFLITWHMRLRESFTFCPHYWAEEFCGRNITKRRLNERGDEATMHLAY